MRTPERKQPSEERAGENPDYSKADQKFWLFAAHEANRTGACFIHPEGKQATHVLLTTEMYRALLHYAPRPMSAKFWNHSHVEPEMMEGWEDAETAIKERDG